ncbi:MAG: hypothetical protein HC933_03915 [Pleurocapsa sp. SU_196_0]|nr:hypothetical protein [Pleurocapsa sp. SU_196_0]
MNTSEAPLGRAWELARLESLILEGVRLVNICGLGGVGKSTLLRYWAETSAGVTVIDCAAYHGRLRARLVDAFRLRIDTDEALVGAAQGLIALDDIGSHPDDLALLRTMLDHGSAQFVVTARRPVKHLSEHVFDLHGLPLDVHATLTEARRSPAVQLFDASHGGTAAISRFTPSITQRC